MRVAALVFAIVLPAARLGAQGVEARTEHFRVATLGSADTAIAAATALERARARFIEMRLAAPPGVTEVVLFRDVAEMEPFGPPRSAGFFQQGTEAGFIAAAWGGAGRDPSTVLAHELAHEILQSLSFQQPLAAEAQAVLLSQLALASPADKVAGFVAGTAPVVRALEPWEWEHRLAELLRAINRGTQAREMLLGLRARFPGWPEPAESLGALEMDAFHYDRAEEWFAEAVRLGSRNANTHYRYSLLLMRPEGSAERAAIHARLAADLDPSQALYWLAKAQAETQVKRWEGARASLAAMRERTSDPVLLDQVRIELAEVDRWQEQERRGPPEPQPPERREMGVARSEPEPNRESATASPSRSTAAARSWPPPGTLMFLGRVQGVEGTEQGKILTLTNRLFLIRVRERRGSPAALYYAPRNMRRIPCTLKNVDVEVVYRPLANFGPLNGDVVAVLF